MSLINPKSAFKNFIDSITNVVYDNPEIGPDFFDEIEEALILADVGASTSAKIVDELNTRINEQKISDSSKIKSILNEILVSIVDKSSDNSISSDRPLVILLYGVNGSGKTTTAAKLANLFNSQGQKVLLAACDTFRAAASLQLATWALSIGVRLISSSEGSDPASVVYDSLHAASAGNYDILICDTAGRLQNNQNLRDELAKINRVIDKEWPEAFRENLLVLDAELGKNAISQATQFSEAVKLSGLVLTKLDSSAKGGITITLADELNIPIKFIGSGEGIEDIQNFNPQEFIKGIFDE